MNALANSACEPLIDAQEGHMKPSPDITAKEAAMLLNSDEATVVGLAEAGQIPAERDGDTWIFNSAAVDTWRRVNEFGVAAPAPSSPTKKAKIEAREDCRILSMQMGLAWKGVLRELKRGTLSGENVNGRWLMHRDDFWHEVYKHGKHVFRANQSPSHLSVPVTRIVHKRLTREQDGKCAICGSTPDKLFVDHCHETDKYRGGLCLACNSGIGYFRDNPSLLEKAIAYLRKHGK